MSPKRSSRSEEEENSSVTLYYNIATLIGTMPKKRFTEDAYRKEPWFRSLCEAICSCSTEEDVADFLRDVGTLSELQAWSERLEVAKQLAKGISYREIAKNTGSSTTTVTRVAKFLENGEGGYRKFLHAHRHHRLAAEGTNIGEIAMEKAESVLQKYLGT